VLEALDAGEELRFESDLRREQVGQSPLRQANAPCGITDLHTTPAIDQEGKPRSDGGVLALVTGNMLQENLLKETEASERGREGTQLLAQEGPSWTPDSPEIDVGVAELARVDSKNGDGTAWFEVNAE
jgi:hypothetical protein